MATTKERPLLRPGRRKESSPPPQAVAEEARDGETVVAVLPGEEATLKRFYLEEDGVRLQPANSTMEPIRVPTVEIRGVVVSVIRQI